MYSILRSQIFIQYLLRAVDIQINTITQINFNPNSIISLQNSYKVSTLINKQSILITPSSIVTDPAVVLWFRQYISRHIMAQPHNTQIITETRPTQNEALKTSQSGLPEPNEGDLSLKEQAYLNSLFQKQSPEQAIGKYFSQRYSSLNQDIAQAYLSLKTDKIARDLDTGKMMIASPSEQQNQQIRDSKYEREVIVQIKQKRAKLERELGFLNSQLNIMDRSTVSSAGLISSQAHKQIVRKLLKQHQEYQQLHKKRLQELEKKLSSQEEAKKQEDVLKQQQEKIEKRRRAESHLHQIKQNQQRRKDQIEEANSRLQEVKKKKFLYEMLQQKYEKEVVLPNLQLKKKKLKELRQFRRPLSIQQIRAHQQEYMKRKEALHGEQQLRKMETDKKYQPPAKSARLERLLEEEKQEKMQQEEGKKRELADKLERAENYALYLKENFKPRIDESKKKEIEERIQLRTARKQAVLDPRQIGLQYLEMSKLKANKAVSRNNEFRNTGDNDKNITTEGSSRNAYRSKSPQEANTSSQSKAHSVRPINYLQVRDQREYHQVRAKKLDKLINDSTKPKTQRLKELRSEAEKLTTMAKRKDLLAKVKADQQNDEEATELLLASIRAKMGIISIYKSDS